MTEILDVLIVGAGHAGLGISYFLKQDNRKYTILERGQIGESWRSQRWDSFAVNTLNWENALPGAPYEGPQPDGFLLRDELVDSFVQYATRFDLPVQTGVTVTTIDRPQDGEVFVVHAERSNGDVFTVEARSVVIASGILHTPNYPQIERTISDDILQLHTASYRNPDALPPGNVVVVGSGQSGVQIVEDLLPTERTIYLCTSKVGRLPRRYRGRDILEWAGDMGFFDVTLDELDDPAMAKATQPQISGVGRYGHSVSLQQLAKEGVVLLGKLKAIKNGSLLLNDDAAEHVRFADSVSAKFKEAIDAYIEREGITPPPLEADPADEPDPNAESVSGLTELNLQEAEVSTIIWATGFRANFDWIRLPVFDDKGLPVHKRGVSSESGLYFLGFPWLHSRKSGIIYGINEDAQFIAEQISAYLS